MDKRPAGRCRLELVTPEDRTPTEVDGRRLTLSNLGKVLYPATGFTKAEVVAYYADVAPVLLPHLRGRALTLKRFPDGVDGPSFFEKHAPRGAPDWVRTVTVPRRAAGADSMVQITVEDRATLVWVANLAALELHVPMWRATASGRYGPVDRMVFDLDPGEPASLVECCRVACRLRAVLADQGLEAYPKTSGAKGLHLLAAVRPARPWGEVRDLARAMAHRAAREHPGEVVANMRRDLRSGKVLLDWSQNHPAKTTVAPYSLRAVPAPRVSAPVSWEEVEACAESGASDDLELDAAEVLHRVSDRGDLLAPLIA